MVSNRTGSVMSRKNRPNINQASRPAVAPEPVDPDQVNGQSASLPATEPQARQVRESVKPHMRCPLCWTGLGGRAARRKWQQAVNTSVDKRCYVCDQCGSEWVVEVRREIDDGVLFTRIKVIEVRTNGEPENESSVADGIRTEASQQRPGSAENERTAECHGNGNEGAAAGNCGADL